MYCFLIVFFYVLFLIVLFYVLFFNCVVLCIVF